MLSPCKRALQGGVTGSTGQHEAKALPCAEALLSSATRCRASKSCSGSPSCYPLALHALVHPGSLLKVTTGRLGVGQLSGIMHVHKQASNQSLHTHKDEWQQSAAGQAENRVCCSCPQHCGSRFAAGQAKSHWIGCRAFWRCLPGTRVRSGRRCASRLTVACWSGGRKERQRLCQGCSSLTRWGPGLGHAHDDWLGPRVLVLCSAGMLGLCPSAMEPLYEVVGAVMLEEPTACGTTQEPSSL